MESAEQEAPDSVVEKARIEQWAMSYAKKKLDDINQQAEEVPGWSKQEARKQIEILSNRIKDDFDRSANRVLAPLFQKYLMALIRLEDFSGSKNFDQAEKVEVNKPITKTRTHLMKFHALIPGFGAQVGTWHYSDDD